MPAILQIVPNPEIMLSLEIPEAAFVLLNHLASNNDGCSRQRPAFLGNLFGEHTNPANGYISADPIAARFKEAITEHLLAAWQWLLREGLLLPVPSNVAGWVFVGHQGAVAAVSQEVFDRVPPSRVDPTIDAPFVGSPRQHSLPSFAASMTLLFLHHTGRSRTRFVEYADFLTSLSDLH